MFWCSRLDSPKIGVWSAVLLLLTILTVIYIGAVVYANAASSYASDSSDDWKLPTDYNVGRSYHAEKMETEPEEWYTLEQLGVIFSERLQYAEKETYVLLIVDEEKALAWMEYDEFTPHALKHEDKFYKIFWHNATPGLPEHVKRGWGWFPVGALFLGVGWLSVGVVFLKSRKKTKDEKCKQKTGRNNLHRENQSSL